MRNLKLVISYDGTAYQGWQIQKGAPTVQGILEATLSKITQTPVRLFGAGRTDTGVHALNQVANFFTASSLSLAQLHRAVNALLPGDIVVKSLTEVDLSFHARYSAEGKVYLYRILNRVLPCPFLRRQAWHITYELNLEDMCAVAKVLIGRHDFSSFRSTGSETSSPYRTMRRLEIVRKEDIIEVEMEANGFLRHMVRILVAALVAVARGVLTQKGLEEILQARDRGRAPAPAPAWGLFLKEVIY